MGNINKMPRNLFHEFFFHTFFRHAAKSHHHTTQKNYLKNVFFYKVRHIFLARQKEFCDDCLDYLTTATEADTSGNASFSNSFKYFLFFLFSLDLKCQMVFVERYETSTDDFQNFLQRVMFIQNFKLCDFHTYLYTKLY